jgi:Flp pilus assembly protein TadD
MSRAPRSLVREISAVVPRFHLTACSAPGIPSSESGPTRLEGSSAAEARYRKAVEAAPNGAPARYDLALVLSQQGRLEEAIVHYEKVAELQRKEPAYPIGLGSAYDRMRRLDDTSAVALSKAIGKSVACPMRGHGSVVVGDTAETALAFCTFIDTDFSTSSWPP